MSHGLKNLEKHHEIKAGFKYEQFQKYMLEAIQNKRFKDVNFK